MLLNDRKMGGYKHYTEVCTTLFLVQHKAKAECFMLMDSHIVYILFVSFCWSLNTKTLL